MPGYTRPWDVLTWLLGSRDADEIDDALRDAGTDLDERLRDILVDVEADPWQLKTPSMRLQKHWSAAHVEVTTGAAIRTNAYLYPSAASDALIAWFPVDLPNGSLWTEVSVRFIKVTAGAIVTIDILRVNADGSVTAIVPSTVPATTAATVQQIAIALSQLIAGNTESYLVKVTLQGDGVAGANGRVMSVIFGADLVWGA